MPVNQSLGAIAVVQGAADENGGTPGGGEGAVRLHGGGGVVAPDGSGEGERQVVGAHARDDVILHTGKRRLEGRRFRIQAKRVFAKIGETGYLGGGNPGAITGWTATGGAGVNGTDIGAGTPFADNGTIPDSTRVAFIQGAGSLSQTLGGFNIGDIYWVQGFANARGPGATDNPVISVTLGADVLLPATLISPVGGVAPYHFVNLPWTASSLSAALTITSAPSAGGDAALLLDGISITKRTANDIVIANPSFEASGLNFGFPGYIGNVAGWTRTGAGGNLAINGTGANTSGNPFADNGAVPDGDDVIGLQQAISISQNLSGLVTGGLYRLIAEYNSRGGDDPTALFRIDGQTAFTGLVP